MGSLQIKNQLKDFLEGYITDYPNPLYYDDTSPEPLVDESNRLTKSGLKEAMYHKLKPSLKKILKAALETDLIVKDDYSQFERLIHLLELIDENNKLTTRGYYKALETLPLKEQCKRYGIPLNTLSVPKNKKRVEYDVVEYYQSLGWEAQHPCNYFGLLLHAAWLDTLAKYVPDRQKIIQKEFWAKDVLFAKLETKALKAMIDLKNKGKYNELLKAHSEYRPIYLFLPSLCSYKARDKSRQTEIRFFSEVKRLTGIADELLQRSIGHILFEIERDREAAERYDFCENKSLEERLKDVKEVQLEQTIIPNARDVLYFGFGGIFIPWGIPGKFDEIKEALLDTTRTITEEKFRKNLWKLNNIEAFEERIGTGITAYSAAESLLKHLKVSIEFLERLFSSTGKENILKIAEAFMDDKLSLSAGWPDILLMKGGHITFLEIKEGNDKLHYNQFVNFKEIQNIFGDVKVVHVVRE